MSKADLVKAVVVRTLILVFLAYYFMIIGMLLTEVEGRECSTRTLRWWPVKITLSDCKEES